LMMNLPDVLKTATIPTKFISITRF